MIIILNIKKNPLLLLLKKPTNPHPCSKQILLCDAEKSGCWCAKSKSLLFHRRAAVTHAGLGGGCCPHPGATALRIVASMLLAGEGAFVSDFLVFGLRKGS